MAGNTLQRIQDGIIAKYKKEYPDEKLYGKEFSLYLLVRYARLLYKLYQKADKGK
jgi:hypothetical protein